jgi:hypothetical protein
VISIRSSASARSASSASSAAPGDHHGERTAVRLRSRREPRRQFVAELAHDSDADDTGDAKGETGCALDHEPRHSVGPLDTRARDLVERNRHRVRRAPRDTADELQLGAPKLKVASPSIARTLAPDDRVPHCRHAARTRIRKPPKTATA